MKRLAILALAAGCSWSTFDDLSAQTPVHVQEKPDGVKATDYAVAITGVTTDSTGGRLAVLSGGNYSTLDYKADGSTSLGDTESLGQHTIDALTANAMLVTDGANHVAIVDNSNVGTIVAIYGTSTALTVDQQIATSMKPDGAAFSTPAAPTDPSFLFVAAQLTAGPNLSIVNVTAGGVTTCNLVVDNMPTPTPLPQVAALAANATHLFVWTKSGLFMRYLISDLNNPAMCGGTVKPSPLTVAMLAPAANGAHIDLAEGKFAILTAFDTLQTQTGTVTVVDTTTIAKVGMIDAHGVRSAAYGNFDGMGGIALGYPNRGSGTVNTGAIDIHTLDLTTGTIGPTPEQTLSNSQADANLSLGRAMTTMGYNGKPIIVAAASNAVYAYYETLLYTKR